MPLRLYGRIAASALYGVANSAHAPTVVDQTADTVGALGRAGTVAVLDRVLLESADATELLAEVIVPTTVLAGREDYVASDEVVRRLSDQAAICSCTLAGTWARRRLPRHWPTPSAPSARRGDRTAVARVEGDDWLRRLHLVDGRDRADEVVEAHAPFVCIGGAPIRRHSFRRSSCVPHTLHLAPCHAEPAGRRRCSGSVGDPGVRVSASAPPLFVLSVIRPAGVGGARG